MSNIDPEVLYLILTKVAAKEIFYSYDATSGTITHRQLAEVYERVTNNRVGARLNWDTPLGQLNALLKKCGLPSLSAVVLEEGGQSSSSDSLSKVQAAKWPPFSALKKLYRKG